MKVILYTVIALILDTLLWGTFCFLLLSVPHWVEGKEITFFHWIVSVFVYWFWEGMRLYITGAYEHMKRSLP